MWGRDGGQRWRDGGAGANGDHGFKLFVGAHDGAGGAGNEMGWSPAGEEENGRGGVDHGGARR